MGSCFCARAWIHSKELPQRRRHDLSHRKRPVADSNSISVAGSLPTEAAPGDRAATRAAAALSIVLIAGSISNSVVAGDTDRLANCVAAADMASAAAKSRNTGVSSAKTTAIIARQLPEALKGKLKAT